MMENEVRAESEGDMPGHVEQNRVARKRGQDIAWQCYTKTRLLAFPLVVDVVFHMPLLEK